MKIDPDNPLPEASFLYRRLLTFGGCIAILVLVGFALWRTPATDMLALAQTLLGVLVIWLVLYFGGASADDVGRLIASVKAPLGRAAPPLPAPRRARDAAAGPLPPPTVQGPTPTSPPWERS